MSSALMIRTVSISLAVLMLTTISYSQRAEKPQADPDASSSASPTPPLQVLYTGKLQGYFRSPNLQSGVSRDQDPIHPCLDNTRDSASPAAKSFLEARGQEANRKLILVGTGDNFAPQLEARLFDPNRKPDLSGSDSKSGSKGAKVPARYQPANKELYSWYASESRWVSVEHQPQALQEFLAQGEGTIPTDNVGCFLSAVGFAAVVPGKHDFYFGADRVRQLARFMASLSRDKLPENYNLPEDYQPPQMLGANLVIKTSRIDGNPAELAKPETIKEWKWPDNLSPTNFKDQVTVYPWLSIIHVKTNDQTLPTLFTCQLTGESKQAIGPGAQSCSKKMDIVPENDGYAAMLAMDPNIQKGKDGHYSTLEPGKNYALCAQDNYGNHCLRFSVYRPFFLFPHAVASKTDQYVDPDPFVLLRKDEQAGRPYDVAIFGVVDLNIGEYVGVLNFSWLNRNHRLKTVVSVEDPREALKQQLEYFKVRYPDFSGMKILLAQMSPQRARLLAARFSEFQMVVTAADKEQATNQTEQSIVWTPNNHSGAFIAVPKPSFDFEEQKVSVQVGTVKAVRTGDDWALSSQVCSSCPIQTAKDKADVPQKLAADKLATAINEHLRGCWSTEPDKSNSKNIDRLKLLTLCAMRERLGADVALVQERDFFDQPPPETDDIQRMLDRVIWKGDLLTLMYVPGVALKKALGQSEKFRSDDNNALSLSDEKKRKLEYIGIRKSGNDYLVNEAPLDDKKIYAVATTDYIGAGDTGYSDLAAAALDPKTRPDQFPADLEYISAVVCRRLVADKAREECVNQVGRDDYLDPSAAPAPPPKHSTVAVGFLNKLPFKWPPAAKKPANMLEAFEQKAQRHPVWTWSLRNLSVGFDGLTKNLSDAQVAQKFGGIPVADVTTQKNSSITAQITTRLFRTSHANEFFVEVGADFKQRSTGDVNPQILQMKNRGTGEIGLIQNLRGGRSATRVGIALYVHSEVPLQKPFSTFTLLTKDRLRITQDRNFLVLPRVGLRWQNRGNVFEGGLQAGREINAFVGYTFNTNGIVVSCVPSAGETFAACVNRLIKAGTITNDSVAAAILENRPRAGLYSKLDLTIPFSDKVKYVLSEQGDFFFNFHRDNAIDTRFRDISKHSLKFSIWPSFSIGPSLQILIYRNKVNGDFLFQRQFGFETSLSFDLFNRREKSVQIKYKPQVFR